MFVWLLKILLTILSSRVQLVLCYPAPAWWSQVPSSCCSNFIMEPQSSVWKYCSLLFEEKLPTVWSWMSSLYLLLTWLVLIHTWGVRSVESVSGTWSESLFHSPLPAEASALAVDVHARCGAADPGWDRPSKEGQTWQTVLAALYFIFNLH